MKRRSGFTLIELLVVVSIIALLIAILLPSLARARDQAKKSACASNLNQLGTAVTAYQAEFDTHLPLENGAHGYATYDLDTNNHWLYLYNYGDPAPAAGTTLNDGTIDHQWGYHEQAAMLVDNGNMTDPRALYCPAQTDGTFMFTPANVAKTTLSNAWMSGTLNGHGGYIFQCHTGVNPDTSGIEVHGNAALNTPSAIGGGSLCAASYPRYTNFPKDCFLMTELLYDIACIPHGDGGGVNGLYIDGHVEYAQSTVVKDKARRDYSTNAAPISGTDRHQFIALFEQDIMHKK